jgi:DNA invertase Pin-like site-specific DNA recombinase
MNVMHVCDNPPCVRPDHLTLGTWTANMQDMYLKGRNRGGTLKGSAVATAKLNETQAATIRKEHETGASIHSLSRRFGVTRTTVRRIVSGESWKHVKAA